MSEDLANHALRFFLVGHRAELLVPRLLQQHDPFVRRRRGDSSYRTMPNEKISSWAVRRRRQLSCCTPRTGVLDTSIAIEWYPYVYTARLHAQCCSRTRKRICTQKGFQQMARREGTTIWVGQYMRLNVGAPDEAHCVFSL
jgi:hypothetical protein